MADKSKKKYNPAFVIMKRELKAYFTGPVAYIVTGLYLILTGILFFSTFFIYNRAELRQFFFYMPVILSFFIPALTMRLFSEERRVGSIETLMTLPVTEASVVMGKYLASFFGTLIMLAPTLFYVVTAEIFGSPDYGPIIGGYVGAIFLCASYTAVGIFASSITKNQILAFFTGAVICIVLTMIDTFLIFLPPFVVNVISYISANQHFMSITRGIIDTRDLLYFISLTALFIAATVKVQKRAKA